MNLFSKRLPYEHGLRVKVIKGALQGCYGELCGGSSTGMYEVDFGENIRHFIPTDYLVEVKQVAKQYRR